MDNKMTYENLKKAAADGHARCAFCGSEIPEDSINMLAGSDVPGVFICYECAREIYMDKDLRTQRQLYRRMKGPKKGSGHIQRNTPSGIKEYLDQYIIGQDKAKQALSVAVYNHFKILRMKQQTVPEEQTDIEKSNIFLIGPSGCGKTAMLKALARELKVPFVIGDATTITEAGYVGDDPEHLLTRLIQAAGGDIKKAEKGIIYIDEIDKIARKGENLSTTADPGHEAVQQSLLKIIEGNVVDVPEDGDQRKHPGKPTVQIDTSNILFIVGGAFEGIEKLIAKRVHKNDTGIGFGGKLKSENSKKYNDYILDVKTEDLLKFGMLPEFVGRIPVICPMQQLDEEALVSVLTKPRNALYKQFQSLLEADGVKLEFTEKALRAVAHEAIRRKTGARSLRSIMEETLGDEMFSLPDKKDVNYVLVDADDEDKFTISETLNKDEEENVQEELKYGC